jgi:hypothetical protein
VASQASHGLRSHLGRDIPWGRGWSKTLDGLISCRRRDQREIAEQLQIERAAKIWQIFISAQGELLSNSEPATKVLGVSIFLSARTASHKLTRWARFLDQAVRGRNDGFLFHLCEGSSENIPSLSDSSNSNQHFGRHILSLGQRVYREVERSVSGDQVSRNNALEQGVGEFDRSRGHGQVPV